MAKSTNVKTEPVLNIATNTITHEPVVAETPVAETSNRTVYYNDPQDVMNSKRYVKGLMEYKAPGEIIQPALNKLKDSNLTVTLTGGAEVANQNLDGTKNLAFGRINVIANTEIAEGIQYELGILFALDLNIPKVKIYRGPKVNACLNLCVFGAEDIISFDMSAGFNVTHVVKMLEDQAEKIHRLHETITAMQNRLVDAEHLQRAIGAIYMKMAEQGRQSKVGDYAIDYGVQLLTTPTSRYYYKQPNFNQWLLYNALTEQYSAKKTSLFEIPEKSFATHELVNYALN